MIASADDFRGKLSEIDVLIKYARTNQRSLDKYKLFIKISIVLMCSHFEVFVEAFLAEHIDVLKKCYNSKNLPQYMKDNYINDTLTYYKKIASPSKKQLPLKALFLLHGDTAMSMNSLNNLILDVKYGFGKHGQEETSRLLKKFGFERFVNSSDYQEAFNEINSAISIRNNIIHEGTAPTLSLEDVIKYKNGFLKFANSWEQFVISKQNEYYGRVVYF